MKQANRHLRAVAALPIVGDEIRTGNPVETSAPAAYSLPSGRIGGLLLPLRPPGKLATGFGASDGSPVPVHGRQIERFDHILAGVCLQQRVALLHKLHVARGSHLELSSNLYSTISGTRTRHHFEHVGEQRHMLVIAFRRVVGVVTSGGFSNANRQRRGHGRHQGASVGNSGMRVSSSYVRSAIRRGSPATRIRSPSCTTTISPSASSAGPARCHSRLHTGGECHAASGSSPGDRTGSSGAAASRLSWPCDGPAPHTRRSRWRIAVQTGTRRHAGHGARTTRPGMDGT